MLCCAVLCCAVLCCAVLCCAVVGFIKHVSARNKYTTSFCNVTQYDQNLLCFDIIHVEPG